MPASSAQPPSPVLPTVHLVELDGRGGVYQHAVALADALHAAGVPVVLHTATDPELEPADSVAVCRCMDWRRDAGVGRRARVAARFLAVTAPHLLRTGGVLHVHGPFRPWLLAPLHLAARLRRRPLVFSPHNTFSRDGGSLSDRLVRVCVRLADTTVVFSEADARSVRGWGARAVVSPLLQHVPAPEADDVDRWRAAWASRPVVVFAGQLRGDKRLDLLIEAGAHWRIPRRLAVVGVDRAAAEPLRQRALVLGVDVAWSFGYQELPAFLAAVAAADVLVCPYDRASQSGVLAVAQQLGVPTIARDVGGLAELATVVVPRDADPESLAHAIDDLLRNPPELTRRDPTEATVAAHRGAYEQLESPTRTPR